MGDTNLSGLSNLKDIPLWYDKNLTGIEHNCHKMFGRYKIVQYSSSMHSKLGYAIIETEGNMTINNVMALKFCPWCGEELK